MSDFNPSIPLAWFSVLLINIAFGSLVAWGTFQAGWVVGLCFSALYSVVLFLVARAAQRKHRQAVDEGGDANGLPTLIDILFLLAVCSVGVTGLIPPLNLFRCERDAPYGDDAPSYVRCNTNSSALPTPEVRRWCETADERSVPPTFVYLGETGTTFFRGSGSGAADDDGSSAARNNEGIWRFDASDPDGRPRLFDGRFPNDLIQVSNRTACFYIADWESNEEQIACTTDGEPLEYSPVDFVGPYDLFSQQDGMLWLKDGRWSEDSIYSVDSSSSMKTTKYEPVVKDYKEEPWSPCGGRVEIIRSRALYSILLSIFPSILASLLVWRRRRVPSMAVTLYAGTSALVVAGYYCYDPRAPRVQTVVQWWFASSSGAWLAGSVLASLLRRADDGVLAWSLNFASPVYFAFAVWLVGVFEYNEDRDAWRWIVMNLVVVVPLLLCSVVVGSGFLLVLASAGLFMDAWKITYELNDVFDGEYQFIVRFLVFVAFGTGVGFMGWTLNRYQRPIQEFIQAQAARWLGRWQKKRVEAEDGMVERDSEEETTLQDGSTFHEVVIGSAIETAVVPNGISS